MDVRERDEFAGRDAADTAAAPAERIHPAWANLMRFCREMGYGELERNKIQDGLPVVAEVATRRVKFT